MADFDKSLYYDIRKAKSYNRFITMVIGARSVGKTYAMKREVITNYIKTGKQFVYLRRTGNQIKAVRDGDSKGGRFFTDIQQDFPNHELDFKGDKFYCNGEVMGYSVALTKPAVLRGASLHNVNIIWFDEFISIGTHDDMYRPNEFNDFMNICDTIIRNRNDVRIYMLANPYSLVNPYFTNLNISVKHGERFTVYPDILIDFYDSKDFAEERKKTAFGRVASRTQYGDFALDNQSLVDSEAFVHERTRTSQFLFNLLYNNILVSVFFDELTGLYYCSEGINKDYKGTVVFEDMHISEKTKYCRHFKDTREMFMMKLAFDEKLIYYDTLMIKDLMFNVYKRCGIMK